MTSDNYIFDIVQNGLSLTLKNIEPSRKTFEYLKTCAESKMLDREIQNFFQ